VAGLQRARPFHVPFVLTQRGFFCSVIAAAGVAIGLGACSGQASETGTTAAATPARKSTTYRFAKPPIAVFYGEKGYPAQWTILVRLNKPLPTNAQRRPRGDLHVDHEPSEAGPSRVGDRKTHACYVAAYGSENDVKGGAQLVKPRDKQLVTVTLSFNRRTSVSVRVRARKAATLAAVNTQQGVRPYLDELGCSS
jgi:hypothetical protein